MHFQVLCDKSNTSEGPKYDDVQSGSLPFKICFTNSVSKGMDAWKYEIYFSCSTGYLAVELALGIAIDVFHKWRLWHGNEARMLFSQSILVSNYQTDLISFLAFYLLSIRLVFKVSFRVRFRI